MQTFGELKTRLTEHDLECILNTKMITANRAEELVKQQVVGDMEEEEDYINASSLFNRVAPPSAHSTPAIEKEELIKRSKALSGVDKISSQPVVSPVQYACFVSIKRLVNSKEEDTLLLFSMEITALVRRDCGNWLHVVLSLLGVDVVCGLIVEAIHQYKAWKYSFSNKHVIITGGSSGLGLEMAKLIASEQGTVTLIARKEEQLKAAKECIEEYCREKGTMTPHVSTEVADVCNKGEMQNAVCNATNKNGAVDVIICNAGIAKMG